MRRGRRPRPQATQTTPHERRGGARRVSGGYAIGIDFGTESGRALLLDLSTGEELPVSVVRYPQRR